MAKIVSAPDALAPLLRPGCTIRAADRYLRAHLYLLGELADRHHQRQRRLLAQPHLNGLLFERPKSGRLGAAGVDAGVGQAVLLRDVCEPCGDPTVTVTPGIGRPCESTIRPPIEPVVVSCAAVPIDETASSATINSALRIETSYTAEVLGGHCIEVATMVPPITASG